MKHALMYLYQSIRTIFGAVILQSADKINQSMTTRFLRFAD